MYYSQSGNTNIHRGEGGQYIAQLSQEKRGVKKKVKKKIALRLHICTILNPFTLRYPTGS
jgi:hypothetical protein